MRNIHKLSIQVRVRKQRSGGYTATACVGGRRFKRCGRPYTGGQTPRGAIRNALHNLLDGGALNKKR